MPLQTLKMSSQQKLTADQKKKLAVLEPQLKEAVKRRDLNLAKETTLQLQSLLRESGHETRLMHCKNWLFEAAIEAGEHDYAKTGLRAVREKTNSNTRVHLEATALLAICLLRQGLTEESKPFMSEVLRNDKVIRSDKKRREFRCHIVRRFEEEAVLGAFKDSPKSDPLFPQEIQDEAGKLVMKNLDVEEIFLRIGQASPPKVSALILQVDAFSRGNLPEDVIKFLPSPQDKVDQKHVGMTVHEALKRRLHASLCDKDSEIYQAWTKQGLGFVLSKTFIGTAVAMLFLDIGSGSAALAIPVAAIIIKLGVEVWCETHKPSQTMLR